MKKVLIQFYSKNNLGDDLFIKIITDRYIDKFSIIAILPNVCFEGIANLKVYSNKVLFTLSKAIEKVLGARNLALQYLMKKNDLFVYVGGSIFIENNITIWRKEKKFYDKLNAPYYILGSNFGPSKTAEFKNIVKKIASGAQDVCFRDRASYNLFKDVSSARVATDIVFTLNTQKFDSVVQEKRIAFSLIDVYKKFDIETAARYEQEIIELAKKSVEGGYAITFVSFCEFEGDEAAINRILAKMDDNLRQKVLAKRELWKKSTFTTYCAFTRKNG